MRWITRTVDEQLAARLSRELGLHPVAARVLAGRRLTDPVEVEKFLAARLTDLPDPFLMKGMTAAVARVTRAIETGEAVTVYGDYDVDGVTSTTLLVSFLRLVGATVDYYVPHRLAEGYGLNPGAVDELAARGTRLIVTVDCGVSAVAEVDRAAQAGVDVVVVDHHQAPAELPRAAAMLNPHQPGCPFPAKELSAVGVTFHLLMALRKRLRETGWFEKERRPEPNLRSFLDLVALGTIADVVPLVGANRILVTHGLKLLGEGERLGVRALKRVAGIADDAPVAAGQVGFRLGPRINAAGRLDDAATAVELLLSRDPAEATQLAQALDDANAQRQAIERVITKAAVEQAASQAERVRGLVLSGEGWHPGVVGIVASRVVERFHRPAVVIGTDGATSKGSCRSIEKFHMYEALGRCREHLVRYGGHHHAAGVTLATENLEAFRRAFEAEAVRQLQPSDLEPSMKVDAELYFGDATLPLAEALGRLGPFGAGNPEPVFATQLASVESRVLPAKDGGPDHLKFCIGEADAIAFGLGDKQGVLRTRAKVAFQLGLDSWQGRTRASAKVKAIEGRG